ncbi:apolipoprotein D-like [Trichoplusia ni]|uniref:Apolipoprotein D-like n=1 Tax=Trichoplusia ni TaxID=7111 RepID=A0A7E5VV55_TRINI|nr:apolipoprotein D-like [Trichoplusia ni]
MWRLLLLTFIATASAQIPSLGWCPDFQAMANFNMNRFLGTWYEAERYFTVTELGTRCVTTHYTATPEGRILVTNEITNSLTGFKRIMEGHLQKVGREGEGRVMVKYSSAPLPYDFEYSILDTDYDSYAVMWSCSGIGPVHTQNTWLLSRDRLPSLAVMQNAYAVLDRYKISRTFFLKTNQADCTVLPEPAAASELGAKSSDVPVDAEQPVKVVEQPVEKSVDPEVKASVPEVRSEPEEEPSKPIPVGELIMSESKNMEKQVEKMEEPVVVPAENKEIPTVQ